MNQLNQLSMSSPQPPAIRCVWMDAGVVNYKLCDRGYDCERCPLDQALHRRPAEKKCTSEIALPRNHISEREVSYMVALFVILTIVLCVSIDGVIQFRKAKKERASRTRTDQLVPVTALADLSAPANLFLDGGHTWVEVKPSGAATIGVDGFAQKLIGRIDDIVLPEVGKEIKRGDVLFAVKQDNHRTAFASPIDGQVIMVDKDLPWQVDLKPCNFCQLCEIQLRDRSGSTLAV